MPRVRELTESLRAEQERNKQADRAKRIIQGAARCSGMNMSDVASTTGIKYYTLLRHLNDGKLTVEELTRIGKILRFDLGTYAACCGAKERCRFEGGAS